MKFLILNRPCAVLWVMALVFVALFSAGSQGADGATGEVEMPTGFGVRVTFGLKDEYPTVWSGAAKASFCAIEELRGVFFDRDDEITNVRAWKCKTRSEVRLARGVEEPETPGRPEYGKIVPVGLLMRVTGTEHSGVEITTPPGTFDFLLGEAQLGRRLTRLEGKVSVEATPWPVRLSGDTGDADHPSLACDAQGEVWLVWMGYDDGADTIWARRFDGAKWSTPMKVSESAGDYFRPAVAADATGVWVVWAGQVEGNWDLFGRRFERDTWSPVTPLTRHPGADINHSLSADSSGNVWLGWQSFRVGNWDIFLRNYSKGRWSQDIQVSASSANDWEPSLAADRLGNVFVAWDSYRTGSYDLFMKRWSGGVLSDTIALTKQPEFEAHVSVACDDQNAVWVAWDEAGANWGKEFPGPGTRLHQTRSVRLGCYVGGRLLRSMPRLEDVIPEEMRGDCELPQVTVDNRGRVWVLFRHKFTKKIRTGRRMMYRGLWRWYAMHGQGDSFSAPILLAESEGRQDMRAATCLDAQGNLWIAWASDGRTLESPAPQRCAVFAARIPAPTQAKPFSALQFVEQKPAAPEPRRERRAPMDEVRVGDRRYRLLWGDLHRHTDISLDGSRDGALSDLYRYALDAANLHFVAATDYDPGGDEAAYPWWRTQKAADMFYAKGSFVPLFGYERALSFPHGHRIVLHASRGHRPIPPFVEDGKVVEDDAKRLWAELAKQGGMTIPHMVATWGGTDWRVHDPEIEPLVEIYQAFRGSFEHAGAPFAPSEGSVVARRYGYKPEGFVWNALAKGYRLGFVAGSDHTSTHRAFIGLYAEERTREAVFAALKRRRCYAATEPIVLEFKVDDHIMGEEYATQKPPKIMVSVTATAPIERIDLVRNNIYIHSVTPQTMEARFSHTDRYVAEGLNCYYVRVMQKDPHGTDLLHAAWASPVWVTFTPEKR